MIIRLHIKDGVELARKYHLPRVIEDIIRQHHGTTLLPISISKPGEQRWGAGFYRQVLL